MGSHAQSTKIQKQKKNKKLTNKFGNFINNIILFSEFVACTWSADLKVCSKLLLQNYSTNCGKGEGIERRRILKEMRDAFIEKCVAYISGQRQTAEKKDLLALLSANICARHFPLLTFFLLFAGFSFRVFLSLLFHLFSTLHGLLPIGLLAQMMQKNHINGSRAPFWHFACAQKEKNNALTFSHLAGQLKRHNAAPAKSLTWPTCSGIFNLCDMRLHTHTSMHPVHPVVPCVAHAICMQQSVRKIYRRTDRASAGITDGRE